MLTKLGDFGLDHSQRRNDPLLSAAQTSGRAGEAIGHYPMEIVKRIRFIKRAQSLGFTLEDVAGLLQLNDSDACTKTRHLATRKLTLIEQKIHELAAIRDALAELVDQCNRKRKRAVCPIIEILQTDSPVSPSARQTPRRLQESA
jgi:hypothetical protein